MQLMTPLRTPHTHTHTEKNTFGFFYAPIRGADRRKTRPEIRMHNARARLKKEEEEEEWRKKTTQRTDGLFWRRLKRSVQ